MQCTKTKRLIKIRRIFKRVIYNYSIKKLSKNRISICHLEVGGASLPDRQAPTEANRGGRCQRPLFSYKLFRKSFLDSFKKFIICKYNYA